MSDRSKIAMEERIGARLDACTNDDWVSWSENNCGPGDPYNVGENG